MSTALLIIDPQIDFCCPVRGTLFVPGAERDMQRLGKMIRRNADKIDEIHVTLDTHHVLDIAHPMFWIDASGSHPEPFTQVTAADVEAGAWSPSIATMGDRALGYLRALEAGGRYTLCIWPYHCLIGSEGQAVKPALFDALQAWESRFSVVDYIRKGTNILTEHHSALRAEVPDPDDPSSQLNVALIDALRANDRVLVGGEAGSHCVAATVRDLVAELGADSARLTLLTDAMSPVPGCEDLQHTFLADMAQLNIGFATTETVFAE